MTATATRLNRFDITIIVLSLVIGMGIFRTPVNVAHNTSSATIFFCAWIIGGCVALCGALTYAEIGSRLPVTGGFYKIFSYAYHPSIAFGVNCLILVSNAAGVAGVAIVGGEYITGILIPASKNTDWLAVSANAHFIKSVHIGIAIASIIIFYGVNLLGLKMSARTLNVLMFIKISLIIMLIMPLFFAEHATIQTSITQSTSPVFLEYLKGFGTGLVGVSFTFGGYQETINFGGEIKDAKKNLPRGIISGILIIISLYLIINYAYIKIIGFEQLKTSKNIAAIMAGKIFGVNAERILSVLLFLSVLAYVNVALMSNPRVMAAMTEDKILPPAFNRRTKKTNALTLSLAVFAAMCVLVVFYAEEFDTILSFSIFLDCFGMSLSAASIFIIRKRTAHLNNTGIYQMKFYPLLPIIFIAAYSFVGISLLITKTKICLVGIAVLSAFIGIYFLVRAFQNKKF